jgi:hypothetical protein
MQAIQKAIAHSVLKEPSDEPPPKPCVVGGESPARAVSFAAPRRFLPRTQCLCPAGLETAR